MRRFDLKDVKQITQAISGIPRTIIPRTFHEDLQHFETLAL